MKIEDMNFTLPFSFHLFTFFLSNLYPLLDQKNFPSMPIWIIGSIEIMFFLYFRENNNSTQFTNDFFSVNKYIFLVCLDYIIYIAVIQHIDKLHWEAINYHKKLTKWPKKYKKTIPIIMKSFLLVFIIFLTCVSSKSRFIINGFKTQKITKYPAL